MKVIIDTDPGTDDVIALMVALNWPELEIQGITTVGGNTSLENTTRNALALLDYLERSEVPVYRGAARSLKGVTFQKAEVHGPGGLTVRLPEPKSVPQQETASEFIVRMARELGSELTLIPLGPLTNVAQAFVDAPEAMGQIKEIVVMGGAVEDRGNVTPHAEFNIYCDPHAANVVFSSGVPVTLIGLDVTRKVAVARDEKDWLSDETVEARLASEIIANFFAINADRIRYSMHDPLTIVAAMLPKLFTFRQADVAVEENGEQAGKTAARYGRGNVRVALDVQAQAARDVIRARLLGLE